MQSKAAAHPQIDFLAVGHVCYDLVTGGRVVGGAAAYAAMTVQALGYRSAIVTSAAPGEDWAAELPDVPMQIIDAEATTIFENVYYPAGRVQTIYSVAGRLRAQDVPASWTHTPIVFLGPIANEIDSDVIRLFSDSVIGVDPQGWMRRWDERGHIYAVDWEDAAEVLPLTTIAFTSPEDLSDPSLVDNYVQLTDVLVVTEGADGCTVYARGERRSFPVPKVAMVDTTGAGDIFAAAYLLRFFRTGGDCWDAAIFANRVASCSVAQFGLRAKSEAIRRLMREGLHQSIG